MNVINAAILFQHQDLRSFIEIVQGSESLTAIPVPYPEKQKNVGSMAFQVSYIAPIVTKSLTLSWLSSKNLPKMVLECGPEDASQKMNSRKKMQ